MFDLSFQFLGGFYSGVVVDYWSIGDEGGFGSVGERGDILFYEGIIRIDAGYHQAITIPSY